MVSGLSTAQHIRTVTKLCILRATNRKELKKMEGVELHLVLTPKEFELMNRAVKDSAEATAKYMDLMRQIIEKAEVELEEQTNEAKVINKILEKFSMLMKKDF